MREAAFEAPMRKAYTYLLDQQQLEDWLVSDPPVYHVSRVGGFPFTTKYHGWVCSDCTGESLKAVLCLRPRIDPDDAIRGDLDPRICLAVDNLLMIRNAGDGYGTFEPKQALDWAEKLNGTELFGKCIVEYSYIECTSSVITALQNFRDTDSTYRAQDVSSAVARGAEYLRRVQDTQGGW